jgi:hypothetical protein
MTLTPIPQPEGVDSKEYKIPAILLGVGILIELLRAFFSPSKAGVTAALVALLIALIVRVGLGVVACYLTARIMGVGFGYLTTAILKLAAVFIFPSAVTFFIPMFGIPVLGSLIAILLYWGLLEWLFELGAMETIALVIIIFFVNTGAIILITAIHVAMK